MDAKIFLGFGERTTAERPIDSAAGLDDLEVADGLVMPDVVEGVTGRARQFDPTIGHGLEAADREAGATLLTRDVTVQAILSWDLAAQAAAAEPGSLIARGKGTSAAEYCAFGLELRVVNEAQLAGELRWLWHDVAGVLKTQIGGHFRATDDVIMLTATRRWVSAVEVELRYFLADELLAEVISADGSIGGGTTGTTSIGARYTGAAYERLYAGTIEQLRVLPRALCAEEIRATWQRIAVHQPRTRQLVRDLHPPGFPISTDPASRVQRENALWGDALGFAVAQAEDLRVNVLPHRAYGQNLEEWERATRRPPKPRDSIETRRARVVARIRQKKGVSIPGVNAALKGLVATDVGNLEMMAFAQTIREDWSAGLREERWRVDDAASWSINSGELALDDSTGAGGAQGHLEWRTVLTSIGGNGRNAHIIANVESTDPEAETHVGVMFGNRVEHDYILAVLDGIAPELRVEVWRNGVLTAAPIAGVAVGSAEVLIHLYQSGDEVSLGADTAYTVRWSNDGGATWNSETPFDAPASMQWAGLVGKFAGVGADLRGAFDDILIRAPFGERSFHAYVYRDPALAGAPDLVGANGSLREIAHAWTHVRLITSKSVLCDDPTCPCDAGPLGGL